MRAGVHHQRTHLHAWLSWGVVAFLTILAAVSPERAAADAWKVEQFLTIPLDAAPDGEDEKYSLPETSSNTIYERSLKGAAYQYAATSFREPVLLPRNADGTVVGFFVYPMNDGSLGEYFPGKCSTDTWSRIGMTSFDAPADIEDLEKALTATHELFHAIQYEYEWTAAVPNEQRCAEPTNWILEGTADAAANLIIEMADPGTVSSLSSENRGFFGLRGYHTSLAQIGTFWEHCVYYCGYFGKDGNLLQYVEVQKVMNYQSSSFWRHIMERLSGQKGIRSLRELRIFMTTKPPNVSSLPQEEWLDWVAAILNTYHGQFQNVYGEFVSEFASWPISKYPSLDAARWLDFGFGGCTKVELTPDTIAKAKLSIEFKGENDLAHFMDPVSARCIEVTISGFKDEMLLHVEAHDVVGKNGENLVDQLTLGLAYEKAITAPRTESCYAAARDAERGDFRCLYFGKVSSWLHEETSKHTRTWRFEPIRLQGLQLRRVMILSNVKPGAAPSETLPIKQMTLNFSVSAVTSSTGKTGFRVPGAHDTATMPDLSTPKRDLLYGIGNGGAMAGFYPLDMAPVQVRWEPEGGLRRGGLVPEDGQARVMPANFTEHLGEFEYERDAGHHLRDHARQSRQFRATGADLRHRVRDQRRRWRNSSPQHALRRCRRRAPCHNSPIGRNGPANAGQHAALRHSDRRHD